MVISDHFRIKTTSKQLKITIDHVVLNKKQTLKIKISYTFHFIKKIINWHDLFIVSLLFHTPKD